MSHLISIIVATLDRYDDLKSLLSQLDKQNTNEIIIVDQTQNYTPWQKADLENIIVKSEKIKYFKIDKKGAGLARNFGVIQSTNDYVIFIDDDVIIPDNFCDLYIQELKKHNFEIDAIAGKVLGIDKQTSYFLPPEYKDKHLGFMFRPMNYGDSIDSNSDLGTCNMLIKKSTFIKLNGFDTKLSRVEDSDLAARFLIAGFKSIYRPQISLIHKVTQTGASRNITKANMPYKSREHWKQYFYFILKNFGIWNGKTLLIYYFKQNFFIKGYLIRPKRLFLALNELKWGYKLGKKMLKK